MRLAIVKWLLKLAEKRGYEVVVTYDDYTCKGTEVDCFSRSFRMNVKASSSYNPYYVSIKRVRITLRSLIRR